MHVQNVPVSCIVERVKQCCTHLVLSDRAQHDLRRTGNDECWELKYCHTGAVEHLETSVIRKVLPEIRINQQCQNMLV